MAKPGSERFTDIPIEIVGSTKFGRYEKISAEQTYNMIVSDDALVPFAGYQRSAILNPSGQGRGLYSSSKQNKMYCVIDSNLWVIDDLLHATVIGILNTFEGDVFITENNAEQILISDLQFLYLYNPLTTNFSIPSINFTPGYVTFQNGRFISPARNASGNFLWRLSDPNDGSSWPDDSQHQGTLQTKPDQTVACVRFPGLGNLLLVFGKTVAEQWQDFGAQLFPYQRSQSTNIDYGCLNPATIAENENMVCWLGANEQSGPVIMYTDGGSIKPISTDGINYKLAQLTQPTNCYGFMFKQDGHLFYVITWVADNLSYAYDFNTDKIFTLSDENQNAFIAKRIAFFNNFYYFVSIRDGNLYKISSNFYDYDYGDGKVFEIPRIRILPHILLPDQSRFTIGYTGFTVEQGQFVYDFRDTTFILGTEDLESIVTEDYKLLIGGGEDRRNKVPRIDLSISNDGGINYGSSVPMVMNPQGIRANRVMWYRLGSSNDLVQQFRFWGFSRYVIKNGITGIRN